MRRFQKLQNVPCFVFQFLILGFIAYFLYTISSFQFNIKEVVEIRNSDSNFYWYLNGAWFSYTMRLFFICLSFLFVQAIMNICYFRYYERQETIQPVKFTMQKVLNGAC